MRQNAMAGAILSLTLLGTGMAMAQTGGPSVANPQTTTPQNPTVPVPPRSSPSTPPERIAPADEGNLSQKLSKDRGTLKPPSVDPGMSVAPPRNGAGTMPVIPPPGSSGGNQSVVPK
ncbi:MAG TPA: hypothetical protein VFG62_25140 [Rhodopila sp.]|nr:hypothetical protein [Rhodopila sp.]